MRTIIIATQNKAKMNDFLHIGKEYLAGMDVQFKALEEKLNPPEEGTISLELNALAKARYYSRILNQPVIADDSGFMVEALNNAPGMFPRRWSESTNETLNQKVIRLLGDNPNRNCTSITSVALVAGDLELVETFECRGTLLYENRDPNDEGVRGMVVPLGADTPLSEMTPEEECLPANCARTRCIIQMFQSLSL